MTDLDQLTSAARATVAAGSARIRARGLIDPPLDSGGNIGTTMTGVTDFRRGRTAVDMTLGSGFDRFAQLLTERFPWLDEDGGGEGDDVEFRLVWAGGVCLLASGVDWTATEAGVRDPAQIVGMLTGAADAAARGDGRFGFVVCVDATTRIAGEAWVDGAGMICRVTSTYDRASPPVSCLGSC